MPQAALPTIQLREVPGEAEGQRLAKALGLPAALAAIAWQRGIRDPGDWARFQESDPSRQHDPRLLPDMDLAVERLLFAREHGQKILIHGDYDVDGLTGTAVLYRALRQLGMDAHAFVPNREMDGYGLARRALERALASGFSLVVTVDCGASEGEIIEELALRGLETVVTDHHLATERPEALAFVNPMRSGSEYPFRHLAGSAIAYKLARALYEALGRPIPHETWLDFVALGTVADVMPLVGENRILVMAGLRELSRRITARRGSKEAIHPAWRSLAREAKLDPGELSAQDLAFRLAPRLNAPGRLGSARLSLNILLTEDPVEADRLARRIEEVNGARRRLEARHTEKARAMALERIAQCGGSARVLAFAAPDWHPGVLGISAARLAEEFAVPALLAGLNSDGSGRGSGRGQADQNMKEILDGVKEHLNRYGGHARAVGFDVKAGGWEDFVRALDASFPPAGVAKEHVVLVDAQVTAESVDRPFLDALEQLGPFGEGNPEPLFLLSAVVPLDWQVLRGEHLRLVFRSPAGKEYRAIAFRRARQLIDRVHQGEETDLCLRMARDTYQRSPGEHGVAMHLVEMVPSRFQPGVGD